MAMKDVSVVLAHRAWAEGSSWAEVIAALKKESVKVSAALSLRRRGRVRATGDNRPLQEKQA